jgi:hypothetical protein
VAQLSGAPNSVASISFGPRFDFVAALAGGGFAVTWTQTVDRVGVAVAHAFSADGTPLVTSTQTVTRVGVAMTQAFSADGTPLGDPAAVAPTTVPAQECTGANPVTFTCPAFQQVNGITATDDGGYIVTWVEGTAPAIAMRAPTVDGTFARRFRADGSPANGVIGRLANGSGQLVCCSPPPPLLATISPDAFVMLGPIPATFSAVQVNAQALR